MINAPYRLDTTDLHSLSILVVTPVAATPQEGVMDEKGRQFLLLVEDNAADVFLVEQAIDVHKVPVSVHLVGDGEIACELLTALDADPRRTTPAVILLDLNLPKRPGTEVLECIRASARLRDVPIIVMTSSDSAEDRRRVSELGATSYFCKPASYREFLGIGATLNEVLERSRP